MAQFTEVAPGVQQLAVVPRDGVNVYLLGDVLVDAGMPFSGRAIARALTTARGPRPLSAHALTHAHPDHQGSSHALCERFQIPLWCGRSDREAMETGDLARLFSDPSTLFARLAGRTGGRAHPVARVLRDGDAVADFTVIESPGHTPGHLAFWRASDRVLVLGDVLFNMNPLTMRTGLREPMRLVTRDPAVNRESARKLAALEPEVVCFGHGPPLRDPAAFQSFVAGLPR